MADNPKQTEIEVDLSKGKLKAKGIYEDLRPLVMTSVEGVNHLLKIAENLIGLPADYVNHHLRQFRERFREGVSSIPEEYRRLPPFRLICVTMREASYSAEEPELQAIFAQLLLTGSDTRTHKEAHPGFAVIIGQLTSNDAGMLIYLREHNWQVRTDDVPRIHDGENDVTNIVIHNLRRLGLVDWWDIELNPFFPEIAAKDYAKRIATALQTESVEGVQEPLSLAKALQGATEQFARGFVQTIQFSKFFGITTTPYGRLFVKSCLGETGQ